MTSIRALARELGVSSSTVLRRIRKGQDPRLPRSDLAGRKREKGRRALQRDIERLIAEKDAIEQMIAMARDGMTQAEMGAELGLSRVAVCRLNAKHGLGLPSRQYPARTIRDQVQDMSQTDAIAHLLHIIEALTGTPDETGEVRRRLGVPPQQARLYLALSKAAPRLVLLDSLSELLAMRPREPASLGVIKVCATNLRKALPPGESVIFDRALRGYRLERIKP